MTEEEFLEICKKSTLYYVKLDEKRAYSREIVSRSNRNKKDATLNDLICEKWLTGGVTGGNCWESGGHHARSGEPEPEFTSLDNILMKVCPNITYLQYKALIGLIKIDEWTEDEYYGNSSNYMRKSIVLKDLYNKLKELGLI